MALESLDIRVRQQGARTVARDVRQVGFAASAASGQLSTTSRILRGFALAAVTRRIFAFADSFTNLNNRVRIFSENQEQANRTSQELIQIANRSRVATDAVSLTFQRLAINQERLGLSTERTLRLTELLSKSVALGGSNAQEAGGALRQFSQGLASDFRAAAQELNSVLEQTPGLARALADGLGTTTDQIKRLAEEGRLSSKVVIDAIESQADVIEARFSRIEPTIGQAFQVFTNSVEVFVGQVFRASDAGKAITSTLITLGQRLISLAIDEERLNQVINTTITALKAFVGIRVASFLFGYAAAMDASFRSSARFVALKVAKAFRSIAASSVLATAGVTSSAGAFALLRNSLLLLPRLLLAAARQAVVFGRALLVAALSNPFTTAIAGAVALGGLLFGLRDELVTVGGQTVRVRDLAVATFEVMSERVIAAAKRVRELTTEFFGAVGGLRGLLNSFVAVFSTLGRLIGEVAGALVQDFAQAFDFLQKGFGNVTRALELAFEGDFRGAFNELFQPLPGEFESAFRQIDVGQVVREEFGRDFFNELLDTVFGGTEIADRARQLFEQFQAQADAARGTGANEIPDRSIRDTTFSLTDQQEALLKLVSGFDVATEVALDFLEAQNKLRSAVEKGVITQDEQRAILERLATNEFRQLAAETDEVAKETIAYNEQLARLNALAAQAGLTGTPELTAAQERLRQSFQDSLEDLSEWQQGLSATEGFLGGVRKGVERFTDGLGTLFSNVSDLTEDLLERGLDAVTEFTTRGTLDFRQFALDAVAEIQKVVLRLLALTALRAAQQSAAGEGSFIGNFFRGNLQEPGPEGASTDTGASGLISGIIGQIAGGGRRGGQGDAPIGVSNDPIFVRILNSNEIAQQTSNPVKEAVTAAREDQAADEQEAAVRQAGLFDRLISGIGGFFSNTFDSISGVFSGGFSSLLGGLGSLGSLLQRGFGSLGGLLGNLLGSIGGLFGGGGGGGDTTSQVLGLVGGVIGIAGGFQSGGNVGASDVGKTFIVGEGGPELFTPSRTGTVVPNEALSAMGGGAAPPVNVQVVNVDDPESIPNAMSTKEGEQVILNTIQRNRGRLRQLIA